MPFLERSWPDLRMQPSMEMWSPRSFTDPAVDGLTVKAVHGGFQLTSRRLMPDTAPAKSVNQDLKLLL